ISNRLQYGMDIALIGIRIYLGNCDPLILLDDDRFLAVIKNNVIVYCLESGLLRVIEHLFKARKTHRTFLISEIPEIVYLTPVFDACPRVPKTIVMVVVLRLDGGQHFSRKG